jgi:putative membrane protein
MRNATMNERAESGDQAIQRTFAGALGGVAGTWAMNHAQRLWTLAAEGDAPESAGGKHDAREWQERHENQNSNELAAQALARHLIGRSLTQDELQVAAPVVHYTFGAAVGALYGACTARRSRISVARGAGLGVALWMIADEIAMPAIGLSRPTTERPVEMHLQSFASHVVYGIVAELVRAAARSGNTEANHRDAGPQSSHAM